MKAIILAAGMGSRMGELTLERPKCLFEINGETVIESQIKSLESCGINDISVVVGYKKEMIIEKCKKFDIKFYTNPLYNKTGVLESLYCAEKELNDPVVIIYGDIYLKENSIQEILKNKDDFCLAVDNSKKIDCEKENAFENYANQKIRKGSTKVKIIDGYIKKISKELLSEETSGESVGITKLSARGSEIFKSKIKNLIETGEIFKYPGISNLIVQLIIEHEKIGAAYIGESSYAELDYKSDYEKAKKIFGKKEVILLDGDDVILRTGESKVAWLKKNFENKRLPDGRNLYDLKPEECSRTLLVPTIGEKDYDNMGFYVYSEEGTSKTFPVEGAIEGVRELSKLAELYLVSARREDHIEAMKNWCKKYDIFDLFKEINSVKSLVYSNLAKTKNPQKLEIAKFHNARIFVDDDSRHMPETEVEGLTCVLFGNLERKNNPPHIKIARNWKEVINYCKNYKPQ